MNTYIVALIVEIVALIVEIRSSTDCRITTYAQMCKLYLKDATCIDTTEGMR